MQKATDKADSTLEAYKSASNEWRGALADSYKTMLSRQEYEAKHEVLTQAVDTVRTRLSEFEGRKFGSGEIVARMATWAGVIIALGVGLTALLVHR